MSKRGLLVSFHGPNGAGKTSIINGVIEKFKAENIHFVIYKYPNRNTILGNKIDKILKGNLKCDEITKIKLFSDNRQEFNKEIIDLLNNGVNIIVDRYTHCSLAYTLTNQVKYLLDNDSMREICNWSFDEILNFDKNIIKPDFAFLIMGNHLHFRNEKKELYHIDDTDYNTMLYNNYIISFRNTKTKFIVIKNKLKQLDESIHNVYNIINNLLFSFSTDDTYYKKEFFGYE